MTTRRMLVIAAALATISFGYAAPSFAQNSSSISQGGTNSVNTAVTNQRGRSNYSSTRQGGRNSDNLSVTEQRGCRNNARVSQGGRNSINEAGVNQRQPWYC